MEGACDAYDLIDVVILSGDSGEDGGYRVDQSPRRFGNSSDLGGWHGVDVEPVEGCAAQRLDREQTRSG